MTSSMSSTTLMMIPGMSSVETALFAVRIISPALVFLATLSLLPARPPQPATPGAITSVVVATRIPRRALILTLLSFISLTYLADGLTFVASAVINKTWPPHTGLEFNAIIGIAAFSGLAAIGAWKDVIGVDVWSQKRVKTSIFFSLALDIAITVMLGSRLAHRSSDHPSWHASIYDQLHFTLPALRVIFNPVLFFALLFPRVAYTPVDSDDVIIRSPTPTASTFLLPAGAVQPSAGLSPVPGISPGEASKYGTFRGPVTNPNSAPTTRATTPVPPQDKGDEKPEVNLDPTWREIGQRLKRISPYLWPRKSRTLKFIAAFCILILIIGRGVNVLLPITLGKLVQSLEADSNTSPWPYLFTYVGLRFLQGSGGLNALRDILWAPVMQYSDREMSQLSFDHLLNLSFAWHTRRKTGEVLRILDRGAAINHTLEIIMFNIIPTFFDIAIALVVFVYYFDWPLGVVIFFVMFAYVAASVWMTTWRTKIRRQMVERDVVTRGIHTDCLLNYETVKYFGGEAHEGQRYSEAIKEYQISEYKVIVSLNLLNLVQGLIITLGLLVGSMIVALRVTRGTSKPYEFVIFITYLAQLYVPLNQLGYIYRSVNQSLVDTEKLLKLLNEPSEVNDKPDAPALLVNDGEIEFDNVHFSYDGRNTALHGISFKVPKGSSVALVGDSGAGKSTILRLLYRFYDLKEGDGHIYIDGQDIRDVTQLSLRKAIGVVPQDSVLFNTSIKYNIGYGKFGATDEEIEAAAKSAQMHERIMSFPSGYETKVGERGVRLSGGEKQRVAIARTLLKDPPILLLDEATSALDTSTEKDIQKALQNLVKGRSSLSIAHRLSTIATADLILVLKDGRIVEQGSHKELLALDGIFAAMWADQISTSGDSEDAPESSIKKKISGYSIGEEIQAPQPTYAQVASVEPSAPEETEKESTVESSEPAVGNAPEDTPKAANESLAPEEHEQEASEDTIVEVPAAPAPIAFPSSDEPTEEIAAPKTHAQPSAPIAFPTSDEATPSETQTPAQSPGVTFGTEVDIPRSGTPDVDADGKRKQFGTQNFQRLARRISLTTKRQGSSGSIPILNPFKRSKDKDSSVDNGGESSVRDSIDSPAGSVKGGADDSKKDRKKQQRKSSI